MNNPRNKMKKNKNIDISTADIDNENELREMTIYSPSESKQLIMKNEEISQVLSLDVPQYDKNRLVPGLIKMKIDKKERHILTLKKFEKLLDDISETLETDLLSLSFKMREEIEQIDEKFQILYKTLEKNEFLLPKSEQELLYILNTAKKQIEIRSNIIETFGNNLNNLEIKRSDLIGVEFKKLVDMLINIAHKLPAEIEVIIESEIIDLNNVITSNTKSHLELLMILRKIQEKCNIDTTDKWNICLLKWRNLRHIKCLHDFHISISSSEYQNPEDRVEFLSITRVGQMDRHNHRSDQINILKQITYNNINSNNIISIQNNLKNISEIETYAMQDCYNGLSQLQITLKCHCANRVEILRKELHVYGYLEQEPDFSSLAASLHEVIGE